MIPSLPNTPYRGAPWDLMDNHIWPKFAKFLLLANFGHMWLSVMPHNMTRPTMSCHMIAIGSCHIIIESQMWQTLTTIKVWLILLIFWKFWTNMIVYDVSWRTFKGSSENGVSWTMIHGRCHSIARYYLHTLGERVYEVKQHQKKHFTDFAVFWPIMVACDCL